MRRFLNITKALSDENRVRVLMALRAGELCACQIIEMLDLSPSTVSKHMSILVEADLVEFRKDGRWHYYRLAGPNVAPGIPSTHEWIASFLKDDKRIAQDIRALKKICLKYQAATPCCEK